MGRRASRGPGRRGSGSRARAAGPRGPPRAAALSAAGDAPSRRARRRAHIQASAPAPTASTMARPARAPKVASAGSGGAPAAAPGSSPPRASRWAAARAAKRGTPAGPTARRPVAERHAGPPLAGQDVERAHEHRQEQQQQREPGDGGAQELAGEGQAAVGRGDRRPPRRARPGGRWPSWRPARGGRRWARGPRAGATRSGPRGSRRSGPPRSRRPGRRRSGARRGAGAGRRATAGRRAARRPRSTERSAMCAQPEGLRSVRPAIQTWTRSPLASPGASSTIAAVIGNAEKRAGTSAGPRCPAVLPSVETKRWGRWWRVVADALARRSSIAVEVVPAGDARPGVSRGATTRMPPGGARCRRPGARRRRSADRTGSPSSRASQVLHLHLAARRAPARAGRAPSGRRLVGRRARRPLGRDRGQLGWRAASVPWPSMVEGSTGSGPGSGVSRVRSATTRATPATSQQVR